jgi:hypothetical protein
MATRTTTTKKVNNWYLKYAANEMLIDMDEQGLFCQVPSEHHEDKLYIVRVDESGVAPVATSCDCPSYKECKHMTIVDTYYKRIYKTNIAKAEAKKAAEVEQIAEELDIPAEEVAKIALIAAEYQQEIKPKHTDLELPIGPGDTRKRKPRKYATEMMEAQQHYASVKSQMAEIRERREAEEGNLYRPYALMR